MGGCAYDGKKSAREEGCIEAVFNSDKSPKITDHAGLLPSCHRTPLHLPLNVLPSAGSPGPGGRARTLDHLLVASSYNDSFKVDTVVTRIYSL